MHYQNIFDDKLIDRLAESYKKYQESKSSDTITTRDDLKTRISEMATQIDNLVGVIVKSGSAVLAQRLSEIEVEKIYLEAEYNQICEVYEIQEITIEKLTESFDMARELLKAGELSATKKLIELYVDRVTVYKNHVDVMFKFHPDITFDNSDNVSGQSEVRETYTTVSTSMGSGRGKTRLASTIKKPLKAKCYHDLAQMCEILNMRLQYNEMEKKFVFVPEIKSVFDIAWYSLICTISSNALGTTNSKVNNRVIRCPNCGILFVASSNRQINCDSVGCQANRNCKKQKSFQEKRKKAAKPE